LSASETIESGELTIFCTRSGLALADKILEAVNSGAIKKWCYSVRCPPEKPRILYRIAKSLPGDTVILTSGCAKYRYNKLNLGNINGIPRVLDAGQCNDSYSWAFVALKLKEVLNLDDINKLPIVFNIAWYEQKAVFVHLALLTWNKNTHIGRHSDFHTKCTEVDRRSSVYSTIPLWKRIENLRTEIDFLKSDLRESTLQKLVCGQKDFNVKFIKLISQPFPIVNLYQLNYIGQSEKTIENILLRIQLPY
jgi:hypothetical protein